MVKQRPILFSTPMVQAILEGRKTQTRRVMKLQPVYSAFTKAIVLDGTNAERFLEMQPDGIIPHKCPYGQPGDVLWVRETFTEWPRYGGIQYKTQAHCDPLGWQITMREDGVKWKPSIHMPKDAARIWLQITDVRLELLWNISEADAKAEGAEGLFFNTAAGRTTEKKYVKSFADIWRSINGLDSWTANPWVWVVEFTVLSTTGKPTQTH